MPNRIPAEGKYNFIDLFAGAGGLSEGFIQAGFNPIAHVEMNSFAAQTLVTRSAYYYLKQVKQLDIYYQYLRGEITRDAFLEKIPNRITKTVICETMSNDTLPGIFKTIDGIMKLRNMQSVDVVIGGPPCQAYSLVGRAQSSHMDHPMSEDPRNELYKLYARVLKRYQPRMFVFENVMGISSANEGTTFKNLKKYLRRVGYEIEWHEQNSKSFGVLQNRRRMIIVGWLKNSGMAYPEFLKKESPFTVNDLLSDLPKLKPGLGSSEYRTKTWSKCVSETEVRTVDDVLTLHKSRPNKERDIEIYKRAIELWNDGHKRLNYNDLPEELKTHKNRHSFVDRIRERIYFSEKMTGILLYTGSADKEGSLGGLVELGNIGKLVPLMKDAFQEALLCTNDPECMSNAPAGNNLNGAACHSCCMISETACENGNRMLDRGLVVPIACRERESYFRELVCELCQLEM